ncbi:MAG TPA: hypothetical protein H9900_00165 [Candidatus Monoglobus merdigallinarum]|uniref:Uncharacterized protein n=1 Tax=Candidatus Monoglobus merdigallinarum TaxID=2838698 RepID=A0A9D1PNX4_9FIRM|nr:hypothetical protein [Candidatus Monoglobus merdigallinarum]
MDIFIEQLVKKKRDTLDYLKIAGGIVGAILVIYLLGPLMGIIPAMGFVILLVMVGLIYLLYLLITSVNMEYEYAFTNGSLDVDAIINRRKRKRLTELEAKEIELMAKRSNPSFERYMNSAAYKKIYACADKNGEDLYFVIYNQGGEGRMLLFSPKEEIVEAFRKMNPQNVEVN